MHYISFNELSCEAQGCFGLFSLQRLTIAHYSSGCEGTYHWLDILNEYAIYTERVGVLRLNDLGQH